MDHLQPPLLSLAYLSSKMFSIPIRRGLTTPQARPALRHDKREKRRIGTPTQVIGLFVGVGFLLILFLTRLHDNDLNVSSSSTSSSSSSAMKELVNLGESTQQQQKQQPANVPHNNGSPLTASIVLQRPLSPSVKVHKLSPNLKSCRNTIVTGYFQLRSKYTADTYLKWMKNMLSIQDCMVVMTSSSMVEIIRSLRQHALDGTVIIEMEVDDLPISQLHAEQTNPKFWPYQLEIDREKKRHKSYQLFWIWLSKTWCVVQVIQKDFFQSSFYMWQDIGAFRDKNYNGKMIIQHPEVVPDGTLLWMAHHPPNPPKSGPIWNDKWNEKVHYFHSGSQGAGAKEVWIEYHGRFAEVMDQFLEKNMFIGEDQCVLQGTCQKYPDLCAYIPAMEVKDNHYFGLRYALYHGIKTKPWQMPGAKAQTSR